MGIAAGGKDGMGRVDQTRMYTECFRKMHVPTASCRAWLPRLPFVFHPRDLDSLLLRDAWVPCTNRMPFWKPNSVLSFLTDSAEQQGTNLLRGPAPGLCLCHSRFAALSLLLSFHVLPPPRPLGVLWLKSLFGHQMGLASWWIRTIDLQMSHCLCNCFF